jgi:periplasmic divalent cation tolerance protein
VGRFKTQGEIAMQNIDVIVVLITVPSDEVGQAIANKLLEEKLAACVNIVPEIRSLYRWESAINDDEERLLIVKSRATLFHKELVPAVLSVHPYQTPEIIALPVVMGLDSYLDWISQETGA